MVSHRPLPVCSGALYVSHHSPRNVTRMVLHKHTQICTSAAQGKSQRLGLPPSCASACPSSPRTPTFQMLASLPYTTAMLLTLLALMSCLSVWLSSSDTKPMKELSGV